jgi:ABC-type dipeptide/oligopeptide/nickel transport system ATPase component
MSDPAVKATSADRPLVEVRDLSISFATLRGRLAVVKDVSFDISPGEVVGLVGESGSGKSVTALALIRLLGQEGRIDGGAIHFAGRDLAQLAPREMLAVRGGEISSAVNPPSGCHFRTRCPLPRDDCAELVPEVREIETDRWVRCHFAGETERTA